MKMKEMGAGERPRERMTALGPGALSNGELLSVILRNGSCGENVIDLSRRLLAVAGNTLTGLFSMTSERMSAIRGLGPCKAASIQAALELGRRFAEEGAVMERRPVTTARMVFELIRPFLKGLRHEECWVIYLNNSNYVQDKCRITAGSGDQTAIDIKQIVRLALDKSAASLILVHNHPSGNPRPSEADVKYTERLHEAAGSMGIALLDHVIICDDCYFSFSDDGMSFRNRGDR